MLRIENITAGYGDALVLRDVSLDVAPGSFLGLIGPNGCGKTTLLRVVTRVLEPADGCVLVESRDVRTVSRRSLARTVACLSQDIEIDFPFTVAEIAAMGRAPHMPRFGGLTAHDREIVREAMDFADVAHLGDRLATELSGGERQRAFIAMCLAQQPRLLLLDEPTTHLDVGHQLAILELIRRLNREQGVTVVGVFHDLNLASEYCDQLAVLHEGRLEADGAPEAVLTPHMLGRVYGVRLRVEPNPVSGKPHVILASDTAAAD
jgi:iron complex transport system ATP-binding protein